MALLMYYRKMLPLEFLVRLLVGGKVSTSSLRFCELTFSLGEARYVRYEQFKTDEEKALYIERHEINAGCIRNDKVPFSFCDEEELYRFLVMKVPLSMHVGTTNRDTWASPLVIDVDVDDYKGRPCMCGRDTGVCDECWITYLRPALRVVLYALQTIEGFSLVLPVFSGRRGFHVWVFDARARDWTKHQRRNFLDCVLQDETPFNPHFESLNPKPLVDRNVTIDPKHLKKAPFFPHPETGLLCLPIDVETFVPSQAVHYSKATCELLRASVAFALKKITDA